MLHRRAVNLAEKREKQKEVKEFLKSSASKSNQLLQSDKRRRKTQLKQKRDPFKPEDLRASAENGCESCRFFHVLLQALLQTLNHVNLDIENLVMEWIEYSFLLHVQHAPTVKSFSFQLFAPSGRCQYNTSKWRGVRLLFDTMWLMQLGVFIQAPRPTLRD